jgi:hypothetical protein
MLDQAYNADTISVNFSLKQGTYARNLFLWCMIPYSGLLAERFHIRFLDLHPDSPDHAIGRKRKVDFNARIAFRAGSLVAPRVLADAVRANIFDVYRSRNNLDIGERELRTLCNNGPIERNERTAVVIEAIAVATLLIRVKVDTTELPKQSIFTFREEDGPIRNTFWVASLMRSTRVYSLRSS